MLLYSFRLLNLLCLPIITSYLLDVGFVLLFLAPFVSKWVPFYYTSSMAVGFLAVVLILLYQARKLLPTGRRNAFYLGIMSIVLGAGSFVVHSLSAFLDSFLQNFGISQEVQNPVSVFVVLGIILLGSGFGYWMVRKYIISKDGELDVGVAVTCLCYLFQSTKDTLLAMAAMGSCLGVYYMITKIVRKMSCRIYATLRELSLGMMEKEWNVSFHWNGRFLNECNSFNFLEFMKRNTFVGPKVAYETTTALQNVSFHWNGRFLE
ncbi:unnamed protein product [Lactuca saligna]|uniref:Uncharacterized protein n=1 Tax=Lactuca saligna TaxID=75948 RepID=A0AA35XZ01_LACSI|nr:unnamed protein product [Lactuca saligna]